MISKIAIAAAAMIVLGVGGFFFLRSPALPASSDDGGAKKGTVPQGAWIEVTAPPVTEYGADGAVIRTLASGDALAPGTAIASGAGAKAIIHFPDGSVARLDEKSRIALVEEVHDAKNKTLRVRMGLSAGRVWSKVVSLATPESLWEIRTSNTVVAVRGTAFGVEFENGRSRVIGAEDAVTVAAIDPQTKGIIPGTEILLKETEMIAIRNDAIAEIKARPETVRLLIQIAPEAVRREQWIEDALREDKKLEQKIESRTKTNQEGSAGKESAPDSIRTGVSPAPGIETSSVSAPPAADDTRVSPGGAPETTASPATAPRLVIEITGGVRTLAQGDTVPLRAFLVIPDGARREVTKESVWRVIGPVGTIDTGTVFHAELLPPITEVGEGIGAIVATWKDPRIGAELTAQTPIFRVELLPQKVAPEG